ncbi:trypsin-2 isoform X2 [Augochlora pura]
MKSAHQIFTILLGVAVIGVTSGDPVNNQTTYVDLEWVSFGLAGRIVNGTKAFSKQFPYQVSLQRSYNTRHFCGGSLIDEYYVLTAAHCMFLSGEQILPWTVTVVGGELQLNTQTKVGQRRGVAEIHVHQDFDSSTLQNDVALLRLKVPFKLTEEITPIRLAVEPPKTGTVCQVSGWGYPSEDYPVVSNDLMYVDLPIIDTDLCGKLMVNVTEMLPGMFCAGYMEGQRDACQGDSGGGMICNGQLQGVVSGGSGCARPETPGIYSSVLFFEEWILANMKAPEALDVKIAGSGTEQVNSEYLDITS